MSSKIYEAVKAILSGNYLFGIFNKVYFDNCVAKLRYAEQNDL